MGVLVDIECSSFMLPASAFAQALAALKTLAQASPHEFRDAEALLSASDFLGALEGESWDVERDEAGLTSIRYGADKAPWDSEPDWPTSFLEALAPFVAAAKLKIRHDGEDMFALTLKNGKLKVRDLG